MMSVCWRNLLINVNKKSDLIWTTLETDGWQTLVTYCTTSVDISQMIRLYDGLAKNVGFAGVTDWQETIDISHISENLITCWCWTKYISDNENHSRKNLQQYHRSIRGKTVNPMNLAVFFSYERNKSSIE